MSSLQSTIMIIAAEISIILIVIIGYIGFRYLRNNRNIFSAVSKLARKLGSNKDDRMTMLQNFLVQTCHYDDDTASTAAADLIKKEHQFYSSLMATYLNQDHNALLDMDNKTEEVIDAYRNLIKVSTMANSTDADPEKLTQNIEELLDKNQKLSDEIDKLKNEMDVTVQEYSSAFRNKQDKGSAADESVEPDFQTSSLDNDEDQDLEALAAQLANEEEDLEENSSIPLDGLDEDDDILKSAGNIGPT